MEFISEVNGIEMNALHQRRSVGWYAYLYVCSMSSSHSVCWLCCLFEVRFFCVKISQPVAREPVVCATLFRNFYPRSFLRDSTESPVVKKMFLFPVKRRSFGGGSKEAHTSHRDETI